MPKISESESFTSTAGMEFKYSDIPTLIKVKRLVLNSKQELGTDYENACKIMSDILSDADKKKVNSYFNKLNPHTLIQEKK